MRPGDRVETARHEHGSEEYDTGIVTAVGAAFVTVSWDICEEVYDEDLADVRAIYPWAVTHLVASMPQGSAPGEKTQRLEAPDWSQAIFRATKKLVELGIEVVSDDVRYERCEVL